MLSEKTAITKPYVCFYENNKRLLQNYNIAVLDRNPGQNGEIAVERV